MQNKYSGETAVNKPEYDDGILHYYVMTIDDAILTFYVDGELMGEGGYSGDPCWIGTVHKINIFNTVLSADEVIIKISAGIQVFAQKVCIR